VRSDHGDTVQDDDADEYVLEPSRWSASSLLTSGTSAITAFTLAVAGVMGFVGYPVAEVLVGVPKGPDDMKELTAVSAMVALALIVGAFWLSQRVFDDDAVPAWARHLAGSSVVIAAIGAVLSTTTIVGSLLADAQ
jgi:hypothetical protein